MPRHDGHVPSIYVGNLSKETRAEDIEREFEKFGKIKDVYLPKDYHTREARGFAYVQFYDERDAKAAYNQLEHLEINGRVATVEWAKGARKTPSEMRNRELRARRGRSPPRRYRSRSRSRGRYHSRSRSRSHSRRYRRYDDDRDRGYSSRGRSRSVSRTPPPRRYSRSPARRYSRSPVRRYSRSPVRRYSRSPARRPSSRTPPPRRYSPSPARRYSRSPARRSSRSPARSYSRSPARRYSRSRSRDRDVEAETHREEKFNNGTIEDDAFDQSTHAAD